MALLVRATAKKFQIITNFHTKLTSSELNYVCLSTVLKQSSVYLSCHGINTRNLSTNKIIKDNQTSKKLETDFGNSKVNNESVISTFDDFLNVRRKEATKTIIVEVQSPDSCGDLYNYCNNYGPINCMHHYTVGHNQFFLVEFQHLESRKSLMTSATHMNHHEIIPVQSQMFSFRNVHGQKKLKKIQLDSNISNVHVPVKEKPTVEKVASVLLNHPSNISKQMEILYNMWKLDDIGTRLRFFTAYQLENSFTSLFPNISVLPFGSSVNGFGRIGCDLDIVMNLDSNILEKHGSRLVFRTKSIGSDQRSQTRKTMELLSSIMQTFMPGISNVVRILKARVPIIKYDHLLTGLECDFSMTNMTAVYMSELLFIYGESSNVVRPLVFTIRQWAASVNITGFGTPGITISNFQITLLVLFYLQQKKILPSINSLKNLSRPQDVRIADTCDCTFLRDVKQFPLQKKSNKETLESLLTGFFEYYSSFDFSTKAISLREGTCLYKPNTDNLYIYNPLEKSLNVSKNVNAAEVVRFLEAIRNASNLINGGSRVDTRGLLDIFAEKQLRRKFISFTKSSKGLNVADLFENKKTVNGKHDITTNNNVKKERVSGSYFRYQKKF